MEEPTMEFIEIRHPHNWLLMSEYEREEWGENMKWETLKVKAKMDEKFKELFDQK